MIRMQDSNVIREYDVGQQQRYQRDGDTLVGMVDGYTVASNETNEMMDDGCSTIASNQMMGQ